jgi:hypothetical protein
MENSNYTQFLASPLLEKFYELPFEEQLKEILHLRKVSEGLFTLITDETSLTTGMKKQEHSIELQFESKKLVVVLHDAFFEFELLQYKEKLDVFFVTFQENIYKHAFNLDILIKHLPMKTLKKMVEA